jgi:thiamine transport system substrate-binding protein
VAFGGKTTSMKKLFFLYLSFVCAFNFSYQSHAADEIKKKLTIYSYSSFVSAWGPGPKLIENFKKECNCDIDLTDMGETNLVIDKMSRARDSKVDIIVGLDQLALPLAEKKLKWMSVRKLQKKGYIGTGTYDHFAAFDWAPLAFVARKSSLPNPPKNLSELLEPRFRNQILLEDARLSTPGLQFLVWIYLTQKQKTKNFLTRLREQVHSISPSWSAAYGLFKKEQALLVFSYLSSPIYHWKEEKDENIQSLAFEEKHPLQTEWVGIPKTCKNCNLASKFIEFLLSDESQKLLMDFNYMYPVNPLLTRGSLYEKLPVVKTFELKDYKNLDIESLLKIWREVFR